MLAIKLTYLVITFIEALLLCVFESETIRFNDFQSLLLRAEIIEERDRSIKHAPDN